MNINYTLLGRILEVKSNLFHTEILEIRKRQLESTRHTTKLIINETINEKTSIRTRT